MRRFELLLAGLVAAAGCGSSPAPEEPGHATAALVDPPAMNFNADWSITTTGSLASGGEAVLRYDVNRLPHCRGSGRIHYWDITAYLSGDGRTASALTLVRSSSPTPDGVVEGRFYVPFGRDLAVWFENSDNGSCTEWDSRFAANFHFPVEAPTLPTLHFRGDWSVSVENSDPAGLTSGDLLIDYDLGRLPTCRASGGTTWMVQADYSFDGSPAVSVPLVAIANGAPVPMPARLTVPPGSRQLTLWFENSDTGGCHAWDSAYGKNYRFTVQP